MSKNLTFSTEISQRYALALYELSKEQNETKEFEANMNLFLKVFNSNKEFKNFIKDPTHTAETQKIIFDKTLTLLKINKTIKNFFLILIVIDKILFNSLLIKK